jgi:hypothetical protein
MTLTGENENIWSKACPNATSSTTNCTLTGLGSRPGLRGESLTVNHLDRDAAECFDLNSVKIHL